MICQSCGKKDAIIHFTKIIDGKMEEIHLCEDCAKEESDWGLKIPFSFNELVSGLIGYGINEKQSKTCPECGNSYNKFISLGKFGCPSCFDVFNRDISPLLRSIHGHDRHTGKIPHNSSEKIKNKKKIEEIRVKLEHAVLEEAFEDAAKYRDEIKALEKEIEDLDQEEKE